MVQEERFPLSFIYEIFVANPRVLFWPFACETFQDTGKLQPLPERKVNS